MSSSVKSTVRDLEHLQFDNRILRSLPVDPTPASTRPARRQIPDAIFALATPTALENPQLIAVSKPGLALLGLNASQVMSHPLASDYFGGNKVLPGAHPAAHCYCGHQFGSFAGQLGDGATMYLGEVIVEKDAEVLEEGGEGSSSTSGASSSSSSSSASSSKSGGSTNAVSSSSTAPPPSIATSSPSRRIEVQFKGAGPTPFSRTADGRKMLRSSIREFLGSELMWSLGIPTTRAGTIVTSDDRIMRDCAYDGNVTKERATVITRMAETFLRFGSFEIFKGKDSRTGAAGPSAGNVQLLKQLFDYTVKHYFPDIHAAFPEEAEGKAAAEKMGAASPTNTASPSPPTSSASASSENTFLTSLKCKSFFIEVIRRSARLVATWQAYGWCHGVLNTDNMSIVGLTIDYGPYAFMERFDPAFICNGSDHDGRYAYEEQPAAVQWNCEKLGEALMPLLGCTQKEMRDLVHRIFSKEFGAAYGELMRRKLGLISEHPALASSPTAAAAGSGGEEEKGPFYVTGGLLRPAYAAAGSRISSAAEDVVCAPPQSATMHVVNATSSASSLPGPSNASNTSTASTASPAPLGTSPAASNFEPLNATDKALITELFSVMEETGADFTRTFRSLGLVTLSSVVEAGGSLSSPPPSASRIMQLDAAAPPAKSTEGVTSSISTSTTSAAAAAATDPALESLMNPLNLAVPTDMVPAKPTIAMERLSSLQAMAVSGHPQLVDHREEIEAEIRRTLESQARTAQKTSDKSTKDRELWTGWLKKYRSHLAAQTAAPLAAAAAASGSASGISLAALEEERKRVMDGANPIFILRNWHTEAISKAASEGDLRPLNALQERGFRPYEASPSAAFTEKWESTPPVWAKALRITCAS